jgi:hypothetical protein
MRLDEVLEAMVNHRNVWFGGCYNFNGSVGSIGTDSKIGISYASRGMPMTSAMHYDDLFKSEIELLEYQQGVISARIQLLKDQMQKV